MKDGKCPENTHSINSGISKLSESNLELPNYMVGPDG